MTFINEKTVLAVGNNSIRTHNPNTHYAVRLNPASASSQDHEPHVAVTQGTINQDTVYGELLGYDVADNRARIQMAGIVTFRSNAVYAAADNGKGVRTAGTAGIVAVGDFGVGKGRIIGGDVININGTDRNVLHVDLG